MKFYNLKENDEVVSFSQAVKQGLGKNQYALQSVRSGLWCSHTTTGLRCTSPTIGDWEVFNLTNLIIK